ncbi:unnamed protein product [Parnassius mnemosyne]|uniref:THAP-type domain-containing protein n=1 Tax=Parnassius mnemosyne TaxID=213953 RepID=A0AAV1M7X0_9NEOP
MKEKWLKVIRNQRHEDDWMPTTYSKVCSEHFLTSDVYITKNNLRRLKKTAVPVIKKEEQNTILSSPSSLQRVIVSDGDSIFDTPRKTFLKTKLRKFSLEKRWLQLNNYNLIRKNKRVKEKCNNLKQIVSELKKKKIFYNTSDKRTKS